MIGSGIPINQSNAPLPKPMIASMFLLTANSTKFRQFPAGSGDAEFFEMPGTGIVFPHYCYGGRHRTPAVPIKVMRCNARMALIILFDARDMDF
jgi:hypothetical protein